MDDPLAPEEFCDVLRSWLGLSCALQLPSRILEDLHLDSIQILELVACLRSLGSPLSEVDLGNLPTVDDAYFYYLQRREIPSDARTR